MIVSFSTVSGSRFHLDHTNHTFVQEKPVLRTGKLLNLPTVVKGRKVQIWTEPPEGSKAAFKVIETAAVRQRDVSFA